MFKKFKKQFKRFMTGKSGFSLVELIVVIAIMAVMAAVLAPALLGYVERSRAQKDDSAMGEVTNAIQLSLADQDVYDELLPYAVKGNFSCYADGDTSTNTDANKTITKAPDYWLFNDEARKLDETAYKPAGSMRGATVTFKPNGSAEYVLKDGIVNQIGDESTKKGTNGGAILEDCPEFYNRLRSTVGDTIKVSSQTYRNSTYTIFISMGTTGGNQADKQDAIQVYGQYNGTNLPEVMTATGSATQDKGNAGSGGSGRPPVSIPAANDGKLEYGVNDPDLNPIVKATNYSYDGITYKLCFSEKPDDFMAFPSIEEGRKFVQTMLGETTVEEHAASMGLSVDEFWAELKLTEETFVEPAFHCVKYITIDEGVTEFTLLESINGAYYCLDWSTFKGGSSVRSIVIPNTIYDIDTTAFCVFDSLTEINFTGTKEQWKAISKNYSYCESIPAAVVHCVDGDVAL